MGMSGKTETAPCEGPYAEALDILGDAINETRDKLLALQEAYEKLGGTYEDEDDGAPWPGQKRLPAPEADGDYAVSINGVSISVTGKQKSVIDLMQVNTQAIVTLDDLAQIYGGVKQRWYNDMPVLNRKLAKARAIIANVRGVGYRLEKA